jgi:hypothetical protein
VTEPIPYVSDDEAHANPRPPRSAGTWVRLLIVWGAGLIVWAFYIAVILYVFIRVIL